MKKKELQEYRKKMGGGLKKEIQDLRKKLHELRLQLFSGKVKNIKEIRTAKKDIATLATILKEKTAESNTS